MTTAKQVQVTFDCADPRALSIVLERRARLRVPATAAGLRLLGRVLARRCPPDKRNMASASVDPAGVGPRLFFQQVPEGKTAKNRVHLDVRAAPGLEGDERMAALEAECERLVALGATRLSRSEPGAADERRLHRDAGPRGQRVLPRLSRRRRRTSERRPSRPCSAVRGLGWSGSGLPGRGVPPLLARGGRARRHRAVRHLRVAAGDVHDAPAAGLRRACRSRSGCWSTGSARAACCSCGTVLITAGPDRVRAGRRRYSARAARAGLRRHGRRDDVHLRAAAGQQLVPGPPDPAGHPADRHPRPARRGRRRDPDDLGARATSAGPAPTWPLPRSAWSLAVALLVVLGTRPASRTCADQRCRSPRCAPAWRRPGRTPAPGSASGCTSRPSSAPPRWPAVGLPVLRPRRGPVPGAPPALLLTLMVVAVMVRRPGPRLAGRRAPVAPLDDGAHASSRRSWSCGPWCWSGRATRRSGCWWCSSSSSASAARRR